MPIRTNLFLSTALSTASAFWLVTPGQTADLNAYPSSGSLTSQLGGYPASGALPAVSEINYKFGGFGGSASSEGFGLAMGSVSAPLGNRWGMQIDGMAGSWGGDGLYGVGGHIFWRDPSSHLLGVYASWTHSDVSVSSAVGDLDYFHIAAEAEWYRGDWTVRGLGGYEFGDITDRFFTHLTADYYATPDIKFSVGYGYEGGDNMLLLGAEWLTGHEMVGGRTALFAEGRIGEEDSSGAWAGLKLYFGPSQTLIDKHRRDDPDWNWFVNTLNDEIEKLLANIGGGGCT